MSVVRGKAWGMEHRVIGQESGARRQSEKSKSEYVFSTDYWILITDYFNIASNLKRSAPPTSNRLAAGCQLLAASFIFPKLYALCTTDH